MSDPGRPHDSERNEARPGATAEPDGAARFQVGDRVRVVEPDSEYTGCRGAVTDVAAHEPGELPLGYWVAVDGENGLARPFLATQLVPLRGARARDRSEAQRSARSA